MLFAFQLKANLLDITNDAAIIKAVILSLKENDLVCTKNKKNETFMASTLLLKDVFLLKDGSINPATKVHILNNDQPVIHITKIPADFKQDRFSVYVSTNKELNIVTKLKATSEYYSKTSQVNVGTIIDPILEFKHIYSPFEDIVCGEN